LEPATTPQLPFDKRQLNSANSRSFPLAISLGEFSVTAKPKKMTRLALRLGVVGVVVALATGLGYAIAWWSGAFEPKIEPDQKAVASAVPDSLANYVKDQVHPVDQPYYAEAIGTLKAASRTQISARVMAEIKSIKVRAGDMVEKGDLLVELDREAMQRRLLQAKAELAAAEAAVDQTETEYTRAQKLIKADPGAITDQQLKQAVFQYETAKAKRSGAEEALAEAEVLLSYTEIRAPKAGTIVERLAEPGDVAQPGIPLLELYDPTSLRLEVPVMEDLAITLKEGDELRVKIDALDNKEFLATVDEIVPQAEAASRSLLVKVKLPPSPELIEGMFGRLMIPAGVRRHLCLNAAAIERIGQLEFVYTVDEDGNPERRYIKTGRYGRPDRVEVLSGLKANETVLVKAKEASEPTPSSAPQG
jgi:RND family efflux transporter MFP subunit